MIRLLTALSILGCLLLPAPAPAQSDPEALERWQRMPPKQKQEMRDRYQRWQNLPPGEKEELQRKFDAWRRLPPEEHIRHQIEQLSPEEKRQLREKRRELRDGGTPEEKRQFREHLSDRFLKEEKKQR